MRRRLPTILAVLSTLAVALLAGCTLEQYPQSTLHPRADYAQSIQDLLETLVFWVVVIFVLTMGALLYAVLRFRSRPGMPDPKHVHGNTVLEIAWTIAPAIILTLVAIPTVLTIFETQGQPPPNALKVRVIGHQWWWEFKYPDLGVTTATEMHVPVGRPIAIDIETADVLHAFWFPAMGGKRDAVPTHVNKMWFTPERTGTFMGQCAELCGTSHANMRKLLVVQTPEEFDAWVAAQKAAPVVPDSTSAAGAGRQVFSKGLCVACHTIDGVSAGVLGPNLNHIASRRTIAGGMIANEPAHLEQWLANPPKMKPGSLMPAQNLSPEQITALVAYLTSLE